MKFENPPKNVKKFTFFFKKKVEFDFHQEVEKKNFQTPSSKFKGGLSGKKLSIQYQKH